MQKDWRSAVAEIKAEAQYLIRRPGSHPGASHPKHSWDFGVVFVCGHKESVVDVAKSLDAELGMGGALLGVAVGGLSGLCTDGLRGRAEGSSDETTGAPGILLTAVQLPEHPGGGTASPEAGLQEAKPFFIGKRELMEISQMVLRLQSRVRVRGAEESANPRAWRQYLGANGHMPKGILLFVDPLATKYTVQTVLAGIDFAFPNAVKFGAVTANLPPSIARLATCVGGNFMQCKEAGVAGLLLPSCVSLHTVVSPESIRVGPELRVTLADGQVVREINELPAAKVLAEEARKAAPLERMLIDRSGFLLGVEAPKALVQAQSKGWDDAWGSSVRAPSYALLQKQTGGSDWLVRSIEPLPNGSIVVRGEDFKQVPPRVGPAWLRCQLHVRDGRWARGELRLMMQRYLGARMTLPQAAPPMGALVCACSSWASDEEAEAGEVGYTELREVLGNDLPIAGVATHGEVAPPGVAIGGVDQKRTTRQGHTASCCVLSYEP